MTLFKLFWASLFLFLLPYTTMAQGYIETGYTPSRSFLDKDENRCGSGNQLQLSGRYTLPFSVKQNEKGQPIAWSGTLSCSYALLNNKEEAAEINPERILNTSFNLSHTRPISDKWYLIASFGAGIYSSPDQISFKSLLANGALIFAYKLKGNLDIGVGVGLTNSYGLPLIMPMSFLKWQTNGSIDIDVEIAGRMKIAATKRMSKHFRLSLVFLDIDGLSAVMNLDGKDKIYGATRLRSYLRPELKIGQKISAYAGIGLEMYNSVKISDRSLKGFASSFKGENSWDFNRTFHIMAGIRYGF
ncbi:DUF6268 family outer membrane beta-barrel protein [uncultured Parabacteroides sp.]|uniref:DUF6268 family outer membrane beta-barrel protein n=1 Tax=uncultured Parabacteroides sp. TaxID=512312 RepID=UPI00259B4D84|nr:DUF6268 family outer membrane beta-barrel protein [uncultured Parabacteroides sp.]